MRKYTTLLFALLLFLVPMKVHAVSGPPTLPGNFPSSNLITFLSSAAAYELMNSNGFGVRETGTQFRGYHLLAGWSWSNHLFPDL